MSRPYFQLQGFRGHSARRAERLLKVYNDPAWRAGEFRSFVLGTLVLELDNLIIHSLRAYAISRIWEYQRSGIVPKARGKYMSSAEYSAHVMRILQPTKYVKRRHPLTVPRDEEQVTRDPKDIEKIILGISGTVPMDLRNAIALNFQIFHETKIVRHFYAHRCEDTMLKLIRNVPVLQSGLVKHPDDYVEQVLPGATVPRYLQWWNEYTDFFSVA